VAQRVSELLDDPASKGGKGRRRVFFLFIFLFLIHSCVERHHRRGRPSSPPTTRNRGPSNGGRRRYVVSLRRHRRRSNGPPQHDSWRSNEPMSRWRGTWGHHDHLGLSVIAAADPVARVPGTISLRLEGLPAIGGVSLADCSKLVPIFAMAIDSIGSGGRGTCGGASTARYGGKSVSRLNTAAQRASSGWSAGLTRHWR